MAVQPKSLYLNLVQTLMKTTITSFRRKSTRNRTETLVRNRNPGVQRRLKLTKGLGDKAGDIDEEDFEKFETDFMNSKEIYESHQREVQKRQRKYELMKTERTYFKPPKNPNMLTWGEKEQIKHLHETDSKTWTVEKLSDSFPATPSIIKKVLKSNWKPENSDKILKHDRLVSQNWKTLQHGKLLIHDNELLVHLKKFTGRKKLVPQGPGLIPVVEHSLPDGDKSEFSRIISEYKEKVNIGIDEKETSIEIPKKLNSPNSKNSTRQSKKHQTLDELRKAVQLSLSDSELYTEEDEHFLKSSQNPVLPVQKLSDEELLSVKSCNENTHPLIMRDKGNSVETDYTYLNEIVIPKDKWKANALYKVKDCYYDSDGEFLYRVPGLTQRNR